MTDELVLNFSPPSASSPAPTRSRSAAAGARGRNGGRWTDRAKERKRNQIEARKASRGTASDGRQQGQHAQGMKRSWEDDGGEVRGEGATAKRERTVGGGPGVATPGGKRRLDMTVGPSGKKQYISSLFTADGLPSAAESSTISSAPTVPSKPSNAPLTSVPSAATHEDEQEGEGEGVDDAPDPAPELSKLGLMRELVAGLAGKLGITGPTACQAGAIPCLIPSSLSKGKGRASSADFAHDAILRAQTGSGKTLTFLLPMLQDLLTLPPSSLPTSPSSSKTTSPDRSIGTLALILAPTRELASQIHTVLSTLLSSLPSSSPDPKRPFTISPRALTAGLLVGGANRTHEKRRLRKGCPIVVATPGRLLDHLKTTEAFRLAGEPPRQKEGAPKGRPGNPNSVALGVRHGAAGGAGEAKVGLRWLIVDECDRLMDLGFEEQMKGILEDIARRSPPSSSTSSSATRRRTILCSATASEGVDRLAGLAISDEKAERGKGMVVVGAREDVKVREPERRDLTAVAGTKRGSEALEEDEDRAEDDEDAEEQEEQAEAESAALALPSGFTPPSQLQHNYIVVPPKLRFVTLVALLRKLLVKASSKGRGTKVLVFMSCTDAVDFWWKALGNMKMGMSADDGDDGEEEEEEDEQAESSRLASLHPLLPNAPVYRLHGSLPLQTRLSSLSAFSSPYTIKEGKRKGEQTDAGVLLCTSVAARGLDVKNVGCVVQVDAPTEGGVTEYVHRVGRTARAGAQGTAYSFVLPSETAYTSFLENGINASSASAKGVKKVRLREVGVEQVLREGYGGEGREYETRATDVQMGFERWVNASEETASLARKAFQAHIRAYATHPSSEKHVFNTKALHLGHLAKSFGMREAPGSYTVPSSKKGGNKKARVSAGGARARDDDDGFEVGPRKRKAMDAEQRMKKLMRGPQALGASEFHIAGTDMLEGVVKRK